MGPASRRKCKPRSGDIGVSPGRKPGVTAEKDWSPFRGDTRRALHSQRAAPEKGLGDLTERAPSADALGLPKCRLSGLGGQVRRAPGAGEAGAELGTVAAGHRQIDTEDLKRALDLIRIRA